MYYLRYLTLNLYENAVKWAKWWVFDLNNFFVAHSKHITGKYKNMLIAIS